MREIVNDAVNDVVDIAHCINFASGVDRGHPCSVQLPPQHFSARALKDTLRHTCTFSYTCICGRCLGLHSVYRLCRLRCHCRRICTGQRLLPFVKKEYGQKSGYELYIYRSFTVHQRQRLHSSRTHALRRHIPFLLWPLQAYNTVGRLKRECVT